MAILVHRQYCLRALNEGVQRDVSQIEQNFNAYHRARDIATFGAAKYSKNGWREVTGGVKRYRTHRRDELLDPDTGLAHLAHEAWNQLAELELMLKERNHVPG